MTDSNELQLDRAEFDAHAPSVCASCETPLRDVYYEANGATVCADCSEKLRASLEDGGSGMMRAVRATGAGFGAAIGGSLLYYIILALTGYEFGLIAIVVGVAVGKAVSWGSAGRGGWRYQVLAMGLTYLAIVGASVPVIISEIRKQPDVQAQAAANTPTAARPEQPVTGGQAVLALALLAGLLLALPFLAGFENIIGIIIIAIGLYEAWKLNRRQIVTITGPHVIASAQLT